MMLLSKAQVDKAPMTEPAPFQFLRSDTHTQEIIFPPVFADDEPSPPPRAKKSSRFFSNQLRSTSAASSASVLSHLGDGTELRSPNFGKLTKRLHLWKRNRSGSVPSNLPAIHALATDVDDATLELQWEKRATMLARNHNGSRSQSVCSLVDRGTIDGTTDVISTPYADDDIQEAIRLHEAGELEKSTQMFGRLADENNALSQVLYGLALRHGWGCTPDASQAIKYLSAAASNAALIEDLALRAGMKKGGAAKGELVLAIFELANCFRHGWGIPVDKVAAKQVRLQMDRSVKAMLTNKYYETAANLGDTDAMNEAAWCYIEGFGCKKDKYAAAKYYRLAEKSGNKIIGNSWIWKDKYDR